MPLLNIGVLNHATEATTSDQVVSLTVTTLSRLSMYCLCWHTISASRHQKCQIVESRDLEDRTNKP